MPEILIIQKNGKVKLKEYKNNREMFQEQAQK